MHEMSIAAGLLELIERQRAQHGFDTVRRVVVSIGALSHVEPQALEFGFGIAARGTCAEHAHFQIDLVPAQVWCMSCSATVSVARRGDACPTCGGYQLIVQGGDEMKLKELEVE